MVTSRMRAERWTTIRCIIIFLFFFFFFSFCFHVPKYVHLFSPIDLNKYYANSVYPDETAHNEPSNQELHYLPFWYRFLTENPIYKNGCFQIQGWKSQFKIISGGRVTMPLCHWSWYVTSRIRAERWTSIRYTDNPHYNDTRYNDKSRYDDHLTVTKPSLKR